MKRERERERDEDGPDDQNNQPSQQEINELKSELEQAKKDKEKLQKIIAKTEKLGQGILNKNKELEDSLKKAKFQLKELEKQTISDKGFWRKEVVIPLVLVLITILLGLIIYFKKRNKK
jgi:DNA repair exonuclease SbcCD ATPase subunit